MPLALAVTMRWWWWLILVPIAWTAVAIALGPVLGPVIARWLHDKGE
jgi:hypothetical protein